MAAIFILLLLHRGGGADEAALFGHQDPIDLLQLGPEQAIKSVFEQDDRDLAIPKRHGRP
jgi:hypothetical protein